MPRNTVRPLSEYVEAFARYAPWESRKFHTRPYGRHALVNDGTAIYQVSHFDDLVSDYAAFFNAEPGMIYTEFPAELWQVFLKEKLNVTKDDFVIDLYRAWKQFWEPQTRWFEEKNIYESAKADSYVQFNRLVESYNKDTDSILETAIELNDTDFLPVIAIAINYNTRRKLNFTRNAYG